MALLVKTLGLRNFRNYESFELKDLTDLTIFVGPNAVGKTNLIEAINLLTCASSFRNARVEDLLNCKTQPARVCLHAEDEQRNVDFELFISQGRKKYVLNGKEKRVAALQGMIPSVVFTPDDLQLVKGGNANRRRALDMLGSQLAASYPAIRRDYEQIVKQKNKLLKEGADAAFLASIDDVLLDRATQLFCYRVSLFEKLLPFIQDFYRDISRKDENLTATYEPSWWDAGVARETFNPHDKARVRVLLEKALEKQRAREQAAKHALVGPHRDGLSFYIDDRDVATFGSQGQQRSLVLAWKLAELALIEEMLQVKPVLLLDDVMSELDESRRIALSRHVLESSQTFITTTNLDYFDEEILQRAHVVHLDAAKEGR